MRPILHQYPQQNGYISDEIIRETAFCARLGMPELLKRNLSQYPILVKIQLDGHSLLELAHLSKNNEAIDIVTNTMRGMNKRHHQDDDVEEELAQRAKYMRMA